MLTDAKAVKAKLNALALAGDLEETNRWKTERRNVISIRVKVRVFPIKLATPLTLVFLIGSRATQGFSESG